MKKLIVTFTAFGTLFLSSCNNKPAEEAADYVSSKDATSDVLDLDGKTYTCGELQASILFKDNRYRLEFPDGTFFRGIYEKNGYEINLNISNGDCLNGNVTLFCGGLTIIENGCLYPALLLKEAKKNSAPLSTFQFCNASEF